ncbi:MAG: cyclomaltodextrin glucanotransferase [Gammaproteobacteria bacterium]|nr:cyclomaltodextrin glucanotransferase [Gammaproteobacteria bacterium]
MPRFIRLLVPLWVPGSIVAVLCCLTITIQVLAAESRFQIDPDKSKGNFKNAIIYYIILDRFHDGDSRNNIPTYAFPDEPGLSKKEKAFRQANRDALRLMYDPSRTAMGLYFGGDLEGVRQKLPYLVDLGVTHIVLSPVMENVNGLYLDTSDFYLGNRGGPGDKRNRSHYAMSAFHGYWTRDWWRMEEHLSSPDDKDPMEVFRRLLTDAKAAGIGVILDITMNHSSPFLTPTFIQGGDIFADGQPFAIIDSEKVLKQDTGVYHKYMDIDFTSPTKFALEHGVLPGGMPDLNQKQPELRRYMLEMAVFWLDFNSENDAKIAGFRVDAIKHIGIGFSRIFETHVLAHNPEAILLGEYFAGGYFDKASIDFIAETDYFSMYDFDISEAAKRFFAHDRKWDGRAYVIRQLLTGQSVSKKSSWRHTLKNIMNPGDILEIPQSNANRIDTDTAMEWVSFLENHDLPRARSEYGDMNDRQYMSALTFLFASPRVPNLLYGTEIGLAVPSDPRHKGLFGKGGDPFNRQMMIFPGQPGWHQKIYDHTKRLIAYRKSVPVLRYGQVELLYPEGASQHEDLFFLRRSSNAGSASSLFAYRTEGGAVTFDACSLGAESLEDVQTGEKLSSDNDHQFHVVLEADTARLFNMLPGRQCRSESK